jgi:hypothetical protein
MKKYKTHILWAIVAIAALAGGVWWGRGMTGASAQTSTGGTSFASGRTFAARGGTAGGGVLAGQIASIGSSSLTLQLANGNSEVVFFSSSTAVTEPKSITIAQLAQGANVAITGTQNSDGSFTAASIRTGGGPGGF